jgi:signal transduction histidine kinase
VDEIQVTLDQHTIVVQAPDEPLVIDGDDLRLEQVIQNLLQNAIKYSPDGGEIRVIVERRGHQVCIAVSDQGIGIPEAARDRHTWCVPLLAGLPLLCWPRSSASFGVLVALLPVR